MFCAALDVSLRSVAACVIDQDGKVRLERSIPSEVPDLVRGPRESGEPMVQSQGLGVRLMKTKGRRRAIVAVARSPSLLHRMWVDGSDFRLGSEAAA